MSGRKKVTRLEVLGGVAFILFLLVFGLPVAWMVVEGAVGMWSDLLDDGSMNWSIVR